ncbi:MAG TPA: hypothetical protein VGS10_24005 [Terracidiphilus sp.]|nr:hypothetical protein [Terracidiphilus sp.]
MTREEFTRQLPELTDNPLPIKPPFLFNGMSARVFPLRASLDALQRVCDGMLNFVPQQAGFFRVPIPYIFLMVLDYGQVAEQVARIGWFAQTEVFFMIPLEWYRLEGGRLVFHDWAVITPYVFVNDDFSVPLGRTVFGFPKVLACVTQSPSQWIKDPVSPVTLARVETDVFPKTYSGAQIERRVFLEVERNTVSAMRLPLDAANPMMPWSIAANMAHGLAGFGRDALWLAQSMRISQVNPGSDPSVFPAMMARMAPWFAPWGTGLVQNSLNLKQFRRSDDPDGVCYQALTNGRMETTAFNGGGLLGEYQIMLGDVSGGHSVRLYDYPSLPIAEKLGLEVHRVWLGQDGQVAEFKPVLPFWINVDIRYEQGDNLAWRTDDGVWKDASGEAFDPQPQNGDADDPRYNITVTTAIDDIAGPFLFSDSTVRVLPLLADRATLQKFVDNYINVPLAPKIDPENPRKPPVNLVKQEDGKTEQIRFQVWAQPIPGGEQKTPTQEDLAYVYLVVSSFGSVASMTNNVGDWTKYQLSFMIPVEFQRRRSRNEWEMLGAGLVPAFSYVDNCTAAIARLEVQGFEATVANFLKPESVWLSEETEFSSNPQQTLLRLDAEVWPALGEGQKSTILPVIEISQGDPDVGLGDALDAAWRWSQHLRAELIGKKLAKVSVPEDLKIGRALALELLGNETPFVAYSLKQFRDCTDPEKACYQSLVRVPRTIKELRSLEEIEETLVVRIHQYGSLDIADQLGLVATRLPMGETGVVSSVQAVRPFFIRGTLYEGLAERLAVRAGTEEWTLDSSKAFSTLLHEQKDAPQITADLLAETLQDQMDPCRMSELMYQAAQRRKRQQPSYTKEEVCEALSRIGPQTVIESVLSREWGNASENTRWRAGRRELIKACSALPLSGDTSAFAESVLYRRINNKLAIAPGAVANSVKVDGTYYSDEALDEAIESLEEEKQPSTSAGKWRQTIERILLSQEKFTRWRLKMEHKLGELAAAAIFNPLGIKNVYSELKKTPPTPDALAKEVTDLLMLLSDFSDFKIAGEPSESHHLDISVAAGRARYEELGTEFTAQFRVFLREILAGRGKMDSSSGLLRLVFDQSQQFQYLVELAREFCDAQNQAFLNKLSRAYQKPDFCIRRDSVGDARDRLLPLSVSWDADWYYGRTVGQDAPKAPASSRRKAAAVKRNGVAKRVKKWTKA